MSSSDLALLVFNLAATLFLTGVAWSLQFVQLPMLRTEDTAMHRRLNTRLVIAPMAIEFVSTVWLAVLYRSVPLVAAFALWCGVAIATAGYTAAHSRGAIDRLKMWNLIRMWCWTARSGILIWVIMNR